MSCSGTDQIVGERRDLLDSANCHIIDPLVLALLNESVVDLTWGIRLIMLTAVPPSWEYKPVQKMCLRISLGGTRLSG